MSGVFQGLLVGLAPDTRLFLRDHFETPVVGSPGKHSDRGSVAACRSRALFKPIQFNQDSPRYDDHISPPVVGLDQIVDQMEMRQDEACIHNQDTFDKGDPRSEKAIEATLNRCQ